MRPKLAPLREFRDEVRPDLGSTERAHGETQRAAQVLVEVRQALVEVDVPAALAPHELLLVDDRVLLHVGAELVHFGFAVQLDFETLDVSDLAGVIRQLELTLPRLSADSKTIRSLTAWPWIISLILNANSN